MKSVKFIQDYDPYVPGDVVDLDEKLADKLVTDSIAREYKSIVLPVSVQISSGGAD
jgi:hypothetical protein